MEDVADLAQARKQQHLQEVVFATPRPLDLEKVQEFCTQGYGCKLIKNSPCSSLLAAKHYATMRANAAELSWAELNMVVMGQLMAHTCLNNDILNSSKYCHPQKEEERSAPPSLTRLLTLHQSITMFFLLVGHTKFAPDCS